jgi:hypothetical protein
MSMSIWINWMFLLASSLDWLDSSSHNYEWNMKLCLWKTMIRHQSNNEKFLTNISICFNRREFEILLRVIMKVIESLYQNSWKSNCKIIGEWIKWINLTFRIFQVQWRRVKWAWLNILQGKVEIIEWELTTMSTLHWSVGIFELTWAMWPDDEEWSLDYPEWIDISSDMKL